MTTRRSGDDEVPETVVVGRIARAHGVRGEVSVDVRTDSVEERFAVGAVLTTEPASLGPLTIRRTRWHSGRLLVTFDGVTDRDVADTLRGVRLEAVVDPNATTGDPDEFFDHHLVGLVAETVDGDRIGTVTDVLHLPGQDLLAIDGVAGEVLVPFVLAIVPTVDVAGGRVSIDPPPGLLDTVEANDTGTDDEARS